MVVAVIVLPWVPESPRWLVYQDRHAEALNAIAVTQADGNVEDPVVLLTYQEIIDTLKTEVETGQKTSYRDLVKSKQSMRRLMLASSVAVISMVSGKGIVSISRVCPPRELTIECFRKQHHHILSWHNADQRWHYRHHHATRDCKKPIPHSRQGYT